MQYHLEYVENPGKFDEIVHQDGVRVLIDSKALFSIIGSEMDWHEDRMRLVIFGYILWETLDLTWPLLSSSSKFIFKNPNIVDACGCGESFNVAAT
jgi:iron-sulfur cluster assembly 1